MEKNNSKLIRAWAFYDWANSAYPLVITTAIFPIFYQSMTSRELANGEVSELVDFFGFTFINTELYSYVLSFSFLVVSALSPLLSGIADYTDSKLRFMKFFCYLGAFSCGMLFFFDPNHIELSMLFVCLASVGFWSSLVFYNAYLPEIADVHLHDKVSAKGFAYGYLGSSILLIGILAVIMLIDKSLTKYAFVAVALWWAGFAQVTYAALPTHVFEEKPKEDRVLWKGYQELRKVWNELSDQPNLKKYLTSFFVYSMGVQTVMLMAVLFAKKEIDWQGQGDAGLIISVLIIQFVAIGGAFLFSKMSALLGNLKVLGVALLIWVIVCLVAYFISAPMHFYGLAGVVGLVMGGIQALSRSTYSKMLPETRDHASYFSFYDVLEKLGIVVGTFSFGLMEGLTESMRSSALVIMVYFIAGLGLLFLVKSTDSIKPVGKSKIQA